MNATKRLKLWILMFPVAVALGLAGCGGGGGGSNAVAALEGTWGGSGFVQGPGAVAIRVTVNGSGQITDIAHNNSSTGRTGTITHEGGNVFGFILDNGVEGGFMTDSARAHAGFLDEDGSFGALQKGASGPATIYDPGDIDHNWAGYSVELDENLNVTALQSSNATSHSGGSFTATDMNGTTPVSLTLQNPTFGQYEGTWGAPVAGNVEAWLSQDKTFAASWACTGFFAGAGTFSNCTFAIWNRQ